MKWILRLGYFKLRDCEFFLTLAWIYFGIIKQTFIIAKKETVSFTLSSSDSVEAVEFEYNFFSYITLFITSYILRDHTLQCATSVEQNKNEPAGLSFLFMPHAQRQPYFCLRFQDNSTGYRRLNAPPSLPNYTDKSYVGSVKSSSDTIVLLFIYLNLRHDCHLHTF